ncbi:MAG: helix-turn-helix domain-containing protein [Candidatus Nanopelagicales bacterium]|nr:helix-turn-helix domain-containing protein [Candidatus Nanopelagicales bacterium]MDZ4249617.1 helix-turn-helix domain-containing protein [Candidatus Nanopelagicales bacterium]
MVEQLRDPAARDAVLTLVAGFESEGAVVTGVKDLVTPREAGELLGVSRQYIDKLIAGKKIPVFRKPASKHRVIRVRDLVAFEAARQEGSARIGDAVNELLDVGAEY